MKRAVKGIFALLIAFTMSATSAYAQDNVLDYANSIGQFQESDTINYVVEATSDGGYIVGGQTMVCVRWKGPIVKELKVARIQDEDNEDYEVVSSSECEEYFTPVSYSPAGVVDTSKVGDFGPGCAMDPGSSRKAVTLGDDDGDDSNGDGDDDGVYYYAYECSDYIAKFKKDGTREWMTALSYGVRPVAVGETANDYRLIAGDLTVLKTSKSGVYAGSFDLQTDSESEYDYYLQAAKIERDGTVFAARGEFLYKYDGNGQIVARLPIDGDTDAEWYYAYSQSNYMVINGEIYAGRGTYDEATDVSTWGIAKISKDFSIITPIVLVDSDEEMVLLSGDAKGDVMVMGCHFDIALNDEGYEEWSNPHDCYVASYDKDGNLLAKLDATPEETEAIWRGDVVILPGYVVYSVESNEVIKLNKNLEVVFSYELAEGEQISSSAIMDDGSVVLVGSSTTSTENYDVSGNMNGIQMRFDAEVEGVDDEPATDGINNPSTLDNVWCYAGAVIVMAGAAIAIRKFMIRR